MEYSIGQIFEGDYPAEAAQWCNASQTGYITEIEPQDGKRRFQIVEKAPHEETPEEIQRRYTQAAQFALDEFARSRGYDGIMSACSYATSTDAQFRLEAKYCVALRDATWRQAYVILDDVIAGTIELPSVEEFLAMLPVADARWPDEQENGEEGEAQA